MEILAGRHQLGTGASCIALSLVGISYPILTQHPRPPCVTTASVVSTQCATGTTAGAVTLTGHRRICAHTVPPHPLQVLLQLVLPFLLPVASSQAGWRHGEGVRGVLPHSADGSPPA